MANGLHVLFATSAAVPELTTDDALAATALRALGCRVSPTVWRHTNPHSVDAGSTIVIRSCWDYHLYPNEFVAWIEALATRGVRVLNAPSLLLWNMHKRYLLELASRGVSIVPTRLVERGATMRLADVLRVERWGEAVVKPAISLDAHETWRTAQDVADRDESRFATLGARGDVLVQLYLREIESVGEWSLMFFGGTFSHAVRKQPKADDFRVQGGHGGTAGLDTPPQFVLAAAERVIAALESAPFYARVDGVEVCGQFLLMELECIDPVLFFGLATGSAVRFATLLVK
ncbi:MAG: hypothetical protein NVS4B3_09710 [Gemmatimonadaceae bacterium]